jgi:hypothetical protein
LYLPASHVKKGIFAPEGPGYQALIFPSGTLISDQTRAKITDFDKAGLPVIFIGTSWYTSPQATSQVKDISGLNSILGDGDNIHHIVSTSQLPDLLSRLGIVPRVAFVEATESIYSVQRVHPITETKFVWLFNDGNHSSTFVAEFSGHKAMKPFHLNAWNGEITPLGRYQLTDSGVRIPLTLKHDETIILAFMSSEVESSTWVTDVTGAVEEVKFTSDKQLVVNLKGPSTIILNNGTTYKFNATIPSATNLSTWDIEIEDWHGNSKNTASIETLVTLHKFSGQHLKPWKDISKPLEKVSGVGTYTTNLTVPDIPNIGAYLSVGPIFNTLRVWVNEKLLPTFPVDNAKVDISEFLTRGEQNVVKVEVTTTLYNRVRADADNLLAVGMPLSTMAPTFADSESQDYGLLGPVWIDWVIGEKMNLD